MALSAVPIAAHMKWLLKRFVLGLSLTPHGVSPLLEMTLGALRVSRGDVYVLEEKTPR
jgi:hypothetical protein